MAARLTKTLLKFSSRLSLCRHSPPTSLSRAGALSTVGSSPLLTNSYCTQSELNEYEHWNRIRSLKEEIVRVNVEMEAAEGEYDSNRAAELKYGTLISLQRQLEEAEKLPLVDVPDPRNVCVSVWWNVDNCTVPPGVNAFRVAQAITSAIKSSGIEGPIQIRAFGDLLQLSETHQFALSNTGVNFTQVPRGGQISADKVLDSELTNWASTNPPPAHVFLITGDTVSLDNVRCFKDQSYNILLASKESAHCGLGSIATITWNWDDLVRGENWYFNQPPGVQKNCVQAPEKEQNVQKAVAGVYLSYNW